MSDALTPLRHAYGVEPPGPPLPLGTPGHAELELLLGTRAALERCPRLSPPAPVVALVLDRAVLPPPTEEAVEDPALASLALALGLPTAADGNEAEHALLAQTLDTLDVLPRRRPRASVLAQVQAAAAQASRQAAAGLAAIRAVYEEGPAVKKTAEVAVLRQARQAVERSLAARPQPRPSAAAVDAVLARAAEAAAVPEEAAVTDRALVPLALAEGLPVADAADLRGSAEYALLAQTADALGRLPRPRPPAHVLDAALTQAISTTAPTAEAAARAEGRAPVPPSRRRFPFGVWAGAGGLVMIALVAVLTLPDGSAPDAVTAVEEAVADAAVPLAAPAAAEPEADAPVPSATEPTEGAAPDAPALVAAAAAPAPVTERAAPATRAAAIRRATPPPPAPPVPAWEAEDDLRALSLRLQELDRETEGLAWDEPAEAFGMPAVGPTSAFTPGVRAVREGAPPARVRYRPDSTRVQR